MPARVPAAGHAPAATPRGMRSRSSSPDGFRGARYEATVAARLRSSDRYKVVYSQLLKCRGGPPLQEVVAACDVRPRPPPAPPGHELELFDLVEAYHDDGWWPGVVSGIRPKRRKRNQKMFAVTFPLFREVVELSASFVRPRREFVYGVWIDAQEVLRGIPQYAEGSRVEVMCDKQGRVWRQAIIKKMVGSTNYVVSYGNEESSIEVLHTRFIRPEPDKMKLEYELCIMGIEEKKYKEMKTSRNTQKTENCSSISKLQADLCQVEESVKYAEADFCSIATAPWQSDDRPLALLR